MTPQPPSRAHGPATAVAVALACALLGGAPLRGDEPELPDADRVTIIRQGSLAVTILTTAPTAPYAALALTRAGDHAGLWSLESPLPSLDARRTNAAATLAANLAAPLPPGPLAPLATHLAGLHAGAYAGCWQWHDPNYLRKFHRDELRVIADGRPVPIGIDETAVYARGLIRAHRASPAAFARAARRDLTHAHVAGDPDLYRGEVLHIEGRLKRINRFVPLRELTLAGVTDLYEAWVFPDYLGANPFCVVFTEWPKGLSPELLGKPAIDAPVRVAVDGFFFKTFRYTANDGRSTRSAPLLIGHTLLVVNEPAAGAAGNRSAHLMLIGFAGTVAALVVGVFGVTYWYRRSDQRVRRRLLSAYAGEFVPPPPDAVPVATPVGATAARRPATGAERPVASRLTSLGGRGPRGAADGPGEDKPPGDGSGA